MSEITVNAQSIARLAYGYELMFQTLCHIAGTSGGSPHWFTQKGQEITARVDPLWKLTANSNALKPGDCLKQYVPFARWAAGAEAALAAKDAEIARLRNKVPARALTDGQLSDEIAAVDAACFGGFGEGGGSPGEWWYERADELEHERKRRELEAKLAALTQPDAKSGGAADA